MNIYYLGHVLVWMMLCLLICDFGGLGTRVDSALVHVNVIEVPKTSASLPILTLYLSNGLFVLSFVFQFKSHSFPLRSFFFLSRTTFSLPLASNTSFSSFFDFLSDCLIVLEFGRQIGPNDTWIGMEIPNWTRNDKGWLKI